MRSNTRLPYGLTLFEASRMAANLLLALAHRMNLLSLLDVLKLAHSNLQAIMCKPLDGPILFWLIVELADQVYNEVQHKTAIWTHII